MVLCWGFVCAETISSSVYEIFQKCSVRCNFKMEMQDIDQYIWIPLWVDFLPEDQNLDLWLKKANYGQQSVVRKKFSLKRFIENYQLFCFGRSRSTCIVITATSELCSCWPKQISLASIFFLKNDNYPFLLVLSSVKSIVCFVIVFFLKTV